MMNRTVILFARAPRYGVGKSRLAKEVGRLEAWRFYRQTIAELIIRLDRRSWALKIAVAHWTDVNHPFFSEYDVYPQIGKTLGERMSHALATADPGPVILTGSDIPGIRATHIEKAFRLLGRADYVFGPAPDGGYWLAGAAKRRPLPRGFMKQVRWSSKNALSDTLNTLPGSAKIAMADMLEDVDDAQSLCRYRSGGSQ